MAGALHHMTVERAAQFSAWGERFMLTATCNEYQQTFV